MNNVSKILSAASLVLGLAVAGLPAAAQQPAQQPAPRPLKQASPAARAAAREILAMKNARPTYATPVPNIVHQTSAHQIQTNRNTQKTPNPPPPAVPPNP